MGPFPTPVLAGSGSRVLHKVESQDYVSLSFTTPPLRNRAHYLPQSLKSHLCFDTKVVFLEQALNTDHCNIYDIAARTILLKAHSQVVTEHEHTKSELLNLLIWQPRIWVNHCKKLNRCLMHCEMIFVEQVN